MKKHLIKLFSNSFAALVIVQISQAMCSLPPPACRTSSSDERSGAAHRTTLLVSRLASFLPVAPEQESSRGKPAFLSQFLPISLPIILKDSS